jgi:hypothetical protein
MQVINVAFRMAMFEFGEIETELLGMSGREVWWFFSGFFKKINETYQFFSIFRLKSILTCI